MSKFQNTGVSIDCERSILQVLYISLFPSYVKRKKHCRKHKYQTSFSCFKKKKALVVKKKAYLMTSVIVFIFFFFYPENKNTWYDFSFLVVLCGIPFTIT